VLAVLLTEYLALAGLAALTGIGAALVASWLLITQGFGLDYRVYPASILGIAGGIALLTVLSGILGSRELLRRPPLPVLRGQ
jgi:putative ABC transport system permease protein